MERDLDLRGMHLSERFIWTRSKRVGFKAGLTPGLVNHARQSLPASSWHLPFQTAIFAFAGRSGY